MRGRGGVLALHGLGWFGGLLGWAGIAAVGFASASSSSCAELGLVAWGGLCAAGCCCRVAQLLVLASSAAVPEHGPGQCCGFTDGS
jgi:hypothetical protein